MKMFLGKIIRENTPAVLYCIYQYLKFTSSVYKMSHLSAPTSILSYVTSNTVDITLAIKDGKNVRKKFIYIYQYNDVCTDNEAAATGLLYGSLVQLIQMLHSTLAYALMNESLYNFYDLQSYSHIYSTGNVTLKKPTYL